MKSYLSTLMLAVSLGCSAPHEPATAPALKPFQPEDLPKGPASASTEDEITPGSWIEILDIEEKDAFFQTKAKLVGKTCVVWGKGLEGDEGLYRGTVRCNRGENVFLTHAKVGVLRPGKIAPQSQPGKTFDGEEVAPGKKVKILGFSYEDQLFPWPRELTSRGDIFLTKYGDLTGKECEVAAETPLSVMSFIGDMKASAASSSTPSSSSAPTSASAPVSAPASKPASQEKPKGLVKTGEQWYGGALLCDKQKIFVYQAWVEVL
jgi:hypothetical protein